MAVVQKLRCRVEKIEDHGDHVYTVELQPERPAPRFRPGQFLHLALDEYDPSGFWPESRVFSIANSALERDRLRISYSVRGRFTARMERELADRRWVWVKLPYGEFVIDDSRDVVMFAGGTGITAFTAFLGHLDSAYPRNVFLVYGARSRRLLIYQDLVCRCLEKAPQLQARFFVEDGIVAGEEAPSTQSQSWAAGLSAPHELVGRIAVDPIWPEIRQPLGADYYISGPPQMVTAIRRDLQARGIPDKSVRIDAWE
ncbi:MAG: FAD-dependent oxidoreductase [Candidatus Methylomirabilota bacterium]|jgi:ferredoxin-NADP reductase